MFLGNFLVIGLNIILIDKMIFLLVVNGFSIEWSCLL